jgi:hypothetical protein
MFWKSKIVTVRMGDHSLLQIKSIFRRKTDIDELDECVRRTINEYHRT